MNHNYEQLIKRTGDILVIFDTHEAFRVMKLTSLGSLQFLFTESKVYTNKLIFDLHTDASLSVINEYRKELTNILPGLLLKKAFTVDTKKTEITPSQDHYVIIDQRDPKLTIEVVFVYNHRKHILNPEFFAVKNELFEDLHIQSLSNLENYALYIKDVLMGKLDHEFLSYMIRTKKILPQQYPFVKKILLFNFSFDSSLTMDKISELINQVVEKEPHAKDLLKELTTYNEKEHEFIQHYTNGEIIPSLIYGDMIAEKLSNHPRVVSINKKLKGEL